MTHKINNDNNNREFSERFRRRQALYNLIKEKHGTHEYSHKNKWHTNKLIIRTMHKEAQTQTQTQTHTHTHSLSLSPSENSTINSDQQNNTDTRTYVFT